MLKRSLFVSFLVCGALPLWGVAVGSAVASPLFSIGEGGDKNWSQAIIDDIQPVVAGTLTGPADLFYFGQVGADNYTLVDSQIFRATDPVQFPIIDGEEHDSLIMSWDPAPLEPASHLSIAAWEYVYDVDPDLTGTTIQFSLGVPPVVDGTGTPISPLTAAIWDVSVELIDETGKARSWFLPMPPVGWSQYSIDVDVGAQGPFVFGESPGFNILKVVKIRLDEAGMAVEFPLLPPGGLGAPAPIWDWNAWDSLSVTPEPSSVALVGLGIVTLLSYARRRRV